MHGEPDENLYVRISGQTNVGDVVVSVCYQLTSQEEADEAFFI